MTIEILRDLLLRCTVINVGLLLVWALLFILAHDWLCRLNCKFFRVSVEQFNAVNYAGIVLFEIGVLLLNVVPLIAVLTRG